MTTNIDRAVETILAAETEYRGHPYDIYPDDLRRWLKALAAEGMLMPDLPEADSDGRLWPEHGFNYSHVQSPKFTGTGNVIIARGASSLVLSREEALELASILTAAAMEEA